MIAIPLNFGGSVQGQLLITTAEVVWMHQIRKRIPLNPEMTVCLVVSTTHLRQLSLTWVVPDFCLIAILVKLF